MEKMTEIELLENITDWLIYDFDECVVSLEQITWLNVRRLVKGLIRIEGKW